MLEGSYLATEMGVGEKQEEEQQRQRASVFKYGLINKASAYRT